MNMLTFRLLSPSDDQIGQAMSGLLISNFIGIKLVQIDLGVIELHFDVVSLFGRDHRHVRVISGRGLNRSEFNVLSGHCHCLLTVHDLEHDHFNHRVVIVNWQATIVT